ncbi:MAG: hypothetical protein K0R20_162 [Actinomycetia bacterium]|jgi:hypothetical protein|nr:hypothetical protein [Actinomycetes bacterium]
MPVTFPDGTTAEIVYPPDLRLEELSVYPDTYSEGGPEACGSTVHATRHDPLVGWIRGSEPLAEHLRQDDTVVALWEGTRDNEPYNYLVYRFGSWSALVPCTWSRQIEGDLAMLAENLDGFETREGLLVLDGRRPLVLHPWRDAASLFISSKDVILDLRSQCDPARQTVDKNPQDGVIQWCMDPAGIYLYANGFTPQGRDYLQRLVKELEVRNVEPSASPGQD